MDALTVPLKAHNLVEADGQAGVGNDVADGHGDARHEALAIDRVVAYGEGLAKCAQHELVVGCQAGHAGAVDHDALGGPPACARDDLLLGLGRREVVSLALGGGLWLWR